MAIRDRLSSSPFIAPASQLRVGNELTKGVHLAFFAFVHLVVRALALQTRMVDLATVADVSWRLGLRASSLIHEL